MSIGCRTLIALSLIGFGGCGSGDVASAPAGPPSTPAATPTPAAGTIRFVAASLPSGSTVRVSPMGLGQQARDLRFRAAVTMNQSFAMVTVQSWVRTASARCLGGGVVSSLPVGVETIVDPESVSNSGHEPPLCALPFTTTAIEFVVVEAGAGRVVLSQSFPATYHFVAAP